MRAGIVINPRAGRGRAVQRAERAAAELMDEGLQADIACSDGAGSATKLARDMASGGCELVFAAGGDGTINEVVQGVAGTDAILGVIPSGLANVWAADVGLTTGAGSFAELIRSGMVFGTDLGQISGRHFLVMAGAGFDAAVVAAVTPGLKARWGTLAYVRAAATCAACWRAPQAVVEVDGYRFKRPLFGLVAANASKYAGVFDLAPDSRLDDGLLEVIVCGDSGALGRFRSMLLAGHRTRRLDPNAHTITSSEVRVRSSQPLLLHADAEMAGTTPCEIHVLPRRLPVLLPPQAQRRYLRPGRPLSAAGASLPRYR